MSGKNTQENLHILENRSSSTKYSITKEEFGVQYQEWAVSIYRFIYVKVQNTQDAEDISSQVFLSALQALPRYKHRGYFSAWLFGIARNKLREFYRKKPHREISIDDTGDKIHSPIIDENHKDNVIQLNNLIKLLPELEQEIILLRYVSNLKFIDIGKILKKSEGAVKKKLYRIQIKLEEMMEENNEFLS